MLPDFIPGTLSSLVWTSDNKGFLYFLANENWRTDNLRLHWLGDPVEKDVELFHEHDEGFRVGVGLTSSEKWITIATGDHVTSEIWLLPADNPLAEPRRSEEHTSELQSLMRISYAVFCLKKKKQTMIESRDTTKTESGTT